MSSLGWKIKLLNLTEGIIEQVQYISEVYLVVRVSYRRQDPVKNVSIIVGALVVFDVHGNKTSATD